MKKLMNQIIRFGIVGVICTIIDFGLMIFLKEVAGVYYLIASGISFAVSVVANYLLSMKFVFHGKKNASKMKEFILFVVLSVIGLGLNQVIMWAAVDGMKISYILSKVGATAIVMVYNFVTKKIFLEEKESGKKEERS
jgi:putative flippase GtrA